MKNEKAKNVLLLILSILVVIEVGYLSYRYDKNLEWEKNHARVLEPEEVSNDKEETNNNTSSEDVVEDKEYIKKITDEIIDELSDKNISYSINRKDNLISIIVKKKDEDCGTGIEKIYNYDLKSKRNLSKDEFIGYLGIDSDKFSKQFTEQYINYFEEDNKEYVEYITNEDADNSKEKLEEVKRKINNQSYDYNDYDLFMDESGNLAVEVRPLLWRESRPEVSWREMAYCSYEIFTFHK